MYPVTDPWKWSAVTAESRNSSLEGWTANGKKTNEGWKDSNTGIIVAKHLVKTVVCDYLDAWKLENIAHCCVHLCTTVHFNSTLLHRENYVGFFDD